MKLRPLRNLVVIKPDEVADKTESGIFLTAKEKPNTGTVVATGPGVYNEKGDLIPTGVDVGDKVMFYEREGEEIQQDGETYRVIPSIQLIGVLS